MYFIDHISFYTQLSQVVSHVFSISTVGPGRAARPAQFPALLAMTKPAFCYLRGGGRPVHFNGGDHARRGRRVNKPRKSRGPTPPTISIQFSAIDVGRAPQGAGWATSSLRGAPWAAAPATATASSSSPSPLPAEAARPPPTATRERAGPPPPPSITTTSPPLAARCLPFQTPHPFCALSLFNRRPDVVVAFAIWAQLPVCPVSM